MDWKIVPLTVQGISFGIGIEAHLFTYAALTGVFLIVVYDMLRIFRRVCPHGVIWIAVEDFFYWLFSSIVIFGVLLKENNGIFRWFFVAGMLLGMVVYYLCVGRYFVIVIAMLINKILDIVKKVFLILWKPVWKVVIFLAKPVKKIGQSILGKIKTDKKDIEKNKKTMYNSDT